MQRKHILRIALATGCLLLVPLLGTLFIDGWNWRPRAFAVWGTILFGTGLIYELVASRPGCFRKQRVGRPNGVRHSCRTRMKLSYRFRAEHQLAATVPVR
jgi:hypothetical protein